MNYIIPPTTCPELPKKIAPALPNYPLPEGYENANAYLEYLAFQGATKLYGSSIPEEVVGRLQFELDIIKEKNVADYFLIIEDMVRIAREGFNILVGPGRGSSAGSLICYCLGITKVDPLKHDLLFERFLSPERNVMPDIDIDCEQGSMDIIVDYLKERYGETNVSYILTYNHARDNERTFISHGIHACDVAMSKLPLSYYTPMAMVDGKVVTVYDGHIIEDAGPIKIDILDWDMLTQMHKIIDLIKQKKQISIDIDSIDTNDQSTLDAFANGETNGVTQFSSNSIKKILLSMKSPKFEDLCALNAMYRPGPMDFIPDYISRKNGDSAIKYQLPIMEKYLKQTHGVMVYQEQLMLLLRLIANFTRAESDDCRKAIGKRKKDKVDVFHTKFIDGGISNGYDKCVLEEVWNKMDKDGVYLFNKSHTVCYTFLAFQMMYLKVHFPDEFYMVISNTK